MSMTQTKYYVQGMKCGSCIDTANKALVDVAGFESAEFDLEAGVTVVQGNVDPQTVCYTLATAGYPAVVKSD